MSIDDFDDFDEADHAPADPPLDEDPRLIDLAVGRWWRQLDAVQLIGVGLGLVAVVLLLVIAVQRVSA
jgi:hypothetical protein